MSPSPAAPRVFAAVVAVALAVWFGDLALGLLLSGCVVAAGVLVACLAATVLFLGLVALAPQAVERMLRGRSRADMSDGGHVGALVVLVAALLVVLGFGAIVSATATVEGALGACALGGAIPTTGEQVLQAVTLNFALFTLPVLLYVGFVHGGGPAGTLRALGLKSEGAARSILLGVLAALLFMGLFAAAAWVAVQYVPEEALQNDAALQIAKSVTVWGALVLAVASGVGEEIFFRGFLQPRVGMIATSVLFALAHFSYGSIAEVVAVLVLSLGLGLLYRRTGNLWAPIAAHFTFNLLNLLAGIYTPETA